MRKKTEKSCGFCLTVPWGYFFMDSMMPDIGDSAVIPVNDTAFFVDDRPVYLIWSKAGSLRKDGL